MRGTLCKLASLAALGLALGGCGVTGLLYTDITTPLDLNARDTVNEPRKGDSGWKTFNYVVRVDWNSSAIADAARAAGITELHFADMRYESILLGIWEKRTAIVYGR